MEVTDIIECKWKESHEPHPSTLFQFYFFDSGSSEIMFVNNYHAYCKPCMHHVYSQCHPCDLVSHFSTHINGVDHITKVVDFPKSEQLLGYNYCNACQCSIEPYIIHEKSSLKELVTKHCATVAHKYRLHSYEDKEISMLVAVSLSPVCRDFIKVDNRKDHCKLCGKDIYEKPRIHLKTYIHLQNLRKYLENKLEFKLCDFGNINKITNLVERLRSEKFFEEKNEEESDIEEKNEPHGMKRAESDGRSETVRKKMKMEELPAETGGEAGHFPESQTDGSAPAGDAKVSSLGEEVKGENGSVPDGTEDLSNSKELLTKKNLENCIPIYSGKRLVFQAKKEGNEFVYIKEDIVVGVEPNSFFCCLCQNHVRRAKLNSHKYTSNHIKKQMDKKHSYFSSLLPFLRNTRLHSVILNNSFCRACKKKQANHDLYSKAHAANLLEYLYLNLGVTILNDEEKIIERMEKFFLKKNALQPEPSPRVKQLPTETSNPARFVHGIRTNPFKSFQIQKYYCGVCKSTGPIPTLKLHVESCFPKDSDRRDAVTELCEICCLQIVRKDETNHFKSNWHKKNAEFREKQEELKLQMKIEAEVSSFIKRRILYVTGFNKDVEHKELFSFFSQFGAIASLTINDDKTVATLRFWEQGKGISKVLAAQPLTFHDDSLNCIESKLKILDDNDVNVALDEGIVHYLLDPVRLKEHCMELGTEALDLLKDSNEIAREDKLFLTLDNLLKRSSKLNWRVFGFGSRIAGLTLGRNSDIDVFAATESTFFGESDQDPKHQKKIVFQVGSWLRGFAEFTDIVQVPAARVPIVKFKHIPTGLSCDLSFKNGLSVRNTIFIRKMLELDDRVRPIVLFLKQWALGNHVKDQLTSYCLTMMAFNYLAQLAVPVLPTLASLRHSRTEEYIIAGWDASFEFGEWKSSNESTIPELLAGFFRFYADFDFDKNIVCLVDCTPLPKANLKRGQSLPATVSAQLEYIPFKFFDFDMCVMDPFDLSHNLTNRIKKWTYRGIIALFRQTAEILEASLAQLSQES